jgi:hypothetical protein
LNTVSALNLFQCRGTVEDTELVDGLVLDQKASHYAGGISRVEKAKIGLIQFCISPPKTDVSVYVHLEDLHAAAVTFTYSCLGKGFHPRMHIFSWVG